MTSGHPLTSTVNGGFDAKIMCKWWVFHCHVWLPQGSNVHIPAKTILPASICWDNVSTAGLIVIVQSFWDHYDSVTNWKLRHESSTNPNLHKNVLLQGIPQIPHAILSASFGYSPCNFSWFFPEFLWPSAPGWARGGSVAIPSWTPPGRAPSSGGDVAL